MLPLMPTEYLVPTRKSATKDYSSTRVLTARIADLEKLDETRYRAQDQQGITQWNRAQWVNSRTKTHQFALGDYVLWYPKGANVHSGKLRNKWYGPYRVQYPLPNNTVLLVALEHFDPDPIIVNINKLKPYRFLDEKQLTKVTGSVPTATLIQQQKYESDEDLPTDATSSEPLGIFNLEAVTLKAAAKNEDGSVQPNLIPLLSPIICPTKCTRKPTTEMESIKSTPMPRTSHFDLCLRLRPPSLSPPLALIFHPPPLALREDSTFREKERVRPLGRRDFCRYRATGRRRAGRRQSHQHSSATMTKLKTTPKNARSPECRSDVPAQGHWVHITAVPMPHMARWREYMRTHKTEEVWVTLAGLYHFVNLDWHRYEPRMKLIERFINTAKIGNDEIRGTVHGKRITITTSVISEVLRLPSGGAHVINLNPAPKAYDAIVGLEGALELQPKMKDGWGVRIGPSELRPRKYGLLQGMYFKRKQTYCSHPFILLLLTLDGLQKRNKGPWDWAQLMLDNLGNDLRRLQVANTVQCTAAEVWEFLLAHFIPYSDASQETRRGRLLPPPSDLPSRPATAEAGPSSPRSPPALTTQGTNTTAQPSSAKRKTRAVEAEEALEEFATKRPKARPASTPKETPRQDATEQTPPQPATTEQQPQDKGKEPANSPPQSPATIRDNIPPATEQTPPQGPSTSTPQNTATPDEEDPRRYIMQRV